MKVHQILKEKPDDGVVTVSPGTTIGAAAEVLSSRRIGALIVSSDGQRPLGILSERDIVRELGRSGPACLSGTVDGIMTKELVTCGADETADALMAKMTEGRFRHVPVMDGAMMIGVVSIGDVVKARLAELAMEKDALEGMIMGY